MSTDLLEQAAPQAIRVIAIGLLEQASAAHVRLTAQNDDEALHDFRVALRRLRSWLRPDAWTGGKPPQKIAKCIQKIAHTTNTFRDAEVLAAWAELQRGALTPRERRAIPWLLNWLQKCAEENTTAIENAHAQFEKLAPHWHSSLAKIEISARVDDPDSLQDFRTHACKLIQSRYEDLVDALDTIKKPGDGEEIHHARIAGKRLRYAIEPLALLVDGADQAVATMAVVQDEFGIACDHQAFLIILEKAARTAAIETEQAEFARAKSAKTSEKSRLFSIVPGLLTLTRIAAIEQRNQYRHLHKCYLGPDIDHIRDPVRAIVDRLSIQI